MITIITEHQMIILTIKWSFSNTKLLHSRPKPNLLVSLTIMNTSTLDVTGTVLHA